ncbi:protein FAM221B [Alexandromys fortis]|uniref:protein FAM221B n=1 Tax=Alexandromys fortis TaxID=100897 RepID=UPI0021534DD7|nr:protein FAM221B [Microtus fortis]
MEANEITDSPQATKDAENRPSLKDPSAEDLREPTSLETETSADLSSSQTSLQLPVYDALFVTSTPPNPETEASESLLEPPDSETPLKSHTTEILSTPSQVSFEAPAFETLSKSPQSVASLEKAITKIPLESLTDEIHSSKVKKKSLKLSPELNLPGSPHKLSSAKGPETQVPGSEHIPKHSLSGPSSQAPADIEPAAKQEEAREEEPIVGTSTISAPAAKPESSVSKKEKRISGYTSRPVVPAKRAELVDVAKAMHREHFGTQVEYLFQWEKDSALKAIQTGLYIGWRCPHYLWDCFRIGDESRCFCGHLLKEHQIISDLSVPCRMSQCRCLMFCFIPSRPEEVGEFWLKRRATFDPKAWRAQCRCKHTHEEHAATGAHPCRHRGCGCNSFESNFLCAACDRRWEEHETFFETEETRRRGGRPYGEGTTRGRGSCQHL